MSLWEGSALIALGSPPDVRMAVPQCGIWDACELDIVDELDGVLSHLSSHVGKLVEIEGGLLDDAFELSLGRWPTEGAVPLSYTFDTVGALTRTVEDYIYFFGCVDPNWGDPRMLLERLATTELANVRMAVPQCGIWDACELDIVDELDGVLSHLSSHVGKLVEIEGGLLDDAFELSLGRWPTEGAVPLSYTFDTVGALTRTVEDYIYFFGCVDPNWGDPRMLLERLATTELANVRMAVPQCGIWDACELDIVDELDGVLSHLSSHVGKLVEIEGGLLDDAFELSLGRRPIASTECRAFLESELPGWLDILHPIVQSRLAQALTPDDPEYKTALADHRKMANQADKLFEEADILVMPGNVMSPPPVADLTDLDRYGETNAAILRPTYPISVLGLTAISIPVGIDGNGMPIGLQLVAPGGQDEALLGVALAAERELGTASQSLGHPPHLLDD